MDILGVGFPELVFIFIIAMMVFGPRRLPEVAAQAGQQVRKFYQMTHGIRAEWQQQFAEAAKMKEDAYMIKEEIQKAKEALPPTPKQLVSEVRSQIKDTISMTSPNIAVQTTNNIPKETVNE
jgi:sec-independent protein translocase protein TatA